MTTPLRWWLLQLVAYGCGFKLAAAATPPQGTVPTIAIFSSDAAHTREAFDLLVEAIQRDTTAFEEDVDRVVPLERTH